MSHVASYQFNAKFKVKLFDLVHALILIGISSKIWNIFLGLVTSNHSCSTNQSFIGFETDTIYDINCTDEGSIFSSTSQSPPGLNINLFRSYWIWNNYHGSGDKYRTQWHGSRIVIVAFFEWMIPSSGDSNLELTITWKWLFEGIEPPGNGNRSWWSITFYNWNSNVTSSNSFWCPRVEPHLTHTWKFLLKIWLHQISTSECMPTEDSSTAVRDNFDDVVNVLITSYSKFALE